MAGMLPGVESARRRRVRQSGEPPCVGGIHGSTRRSCFCLYASNHESHHTSTSPLQRSILNQAYMDEKLGVEAREAKGRLDERLRTQRKSQLKRHNNSNNKGLKSVDGGGRSSVVLGELQKEVYGAKKSSSSTSGSKKFSWSKLSWKSSDQDECAVCLERFSPGETLVHLPCAHRFHSGCMVPWLHSNAHCPCCRMEISPSNCIGNFVN
ncbi:hypothetical protein ACFX13_017807 [Malus domestica]